MAAFFLGSLLVVGVTPPAAAAAAAAAEGVSGCCSLFFLVFPVLDSTAVYLPFLVTLGLFSTNLLSLRFASPLSLLSLSLVLLLVLPLPPPAAEEAAVKRGMLDAG